MKKITPTTDGDTHQETQRESRSSREVDPCPHAQWAYNEQRSVSGFDQATAGRMDYDYCEHGHQIDAEPPTDTCYPARRPEPGQCGEAEDRGDQQNHIGERNAVPDGQSAHVEGCGRHQERNGDRRSRDQSEHRAKADERSGELGFSDGQIPGKQTKEGAHQRTSGYAGPETPEWVSIVSELSAGRPAENSSYSIVVAGWHCRCQRAILSRSLTCTSFGRLQSILEAGGCGVTRSTSTESPAPRSSTCSPAEMTHGATSGSPGPVGRTDGSLPWPPMVVIVAYGSEDQLEACLHTLGPDLPVVVVDNGGSDRAQRICQSSGATYVRPHTNIGFAAAVNVALRGHRDPGSDVLLLNPDARLRVTDLTKMRDELHRSSDLAAVGPQAGQSRLGSAQKELWPIPSPWSALSGVIGAADLLSRRRFVSGAVLLLRGTAIDSVGTFDERFFLYAEETDWQLRALKAGWRVGLAPDATAVHLSGGTSADPVRRELLFDASAERFARKWYGTFGWQLFRAASILAALRRLVMARDMRSEDDPTQGHRPLLERSCPVCAESRGDQLRIAHVVRSDSFGGVERYVCMVAPRLAARGCEVAVVGGDPAQMARVSDVVRWRPASTTWQVARELKRLGRLDIVHAHMTAAEVAAVITKPLHHARLVTTLHFASPRGSGSTQGAPDASGVVDGRANCHQ